MEGSRLRALVKPACLCLAILLGVAETGAAGIIAMSPAADPADASRFPNFAAALDQARALVKAGKGEEVTHPDDLIGIGRCRRLLALTKLACLCLATVLGLAETGVAGGIGIVLLYGKTGMPGLPRRIFA